ncbi:hypothetical protein JOQ06_007512 [Pogonophryne albipinna]|uniref:LEM domain-containing protein n=1 Tax=Pogonophryne albipinna TaxID=1090488 RepID=A0AAD6B1V2_9TELE|nr:hypothetical protein JOQ06_007512 [Pogonophryne albipinna]
MSLFMEDPAHFSKSRLKSDLVAHNVVLPPTKSRKEIYVDLHLKHIAQKNAGDFSSDDEDQEKDLADKEEKEDAEILVQSCLTDDDLKAALLKHGVKAGPIVASTRALYENKLRRLQQSEGQGHVNGVEKGVLYSDSEEEEEQGEQEDGESGSEGAKEEIDELSNQAQQGSSQPDTPIVDTMKNQSPYYTPKESTYKLKMKPSQEPVKDTIKEMFLNMEASPTGICATRRRPIKGAAGRPVQYIYPDSPTTLERREVERRLVPIHIQILVFFIVACLLYIIYVCVEENSFSPFVALLDSPDQGSESEEGLVLQAETQDTPVISGQE